MSDTENKQSNDTQAELAAVVASLKAEIEQLKSKQAAPKEEEDLQTKAKNKQEQLDNEASKSKRLEAALTFNLKSADFLKQNSALLPKEAEDIFALADKENYADAIEKDCAIKSGLIQSFFAVQSNVDLLTGAQRASLDDFLKLTKNGKQDKAQHIFDTIFEPTFEMLRRVKKAESLKKGYGTQDGTTDAYKQRMINLSKKHYNMGDRT